MWVHYSATILYSATPHIAIRLELRVPCALHTKSPSERNQNAQDLAAWQTANYQENFFQPEYIFGKPLPALTSGSLCGYQISKLINVLIGKIYKLDAVNFGEAAEL